MVRTPKKPEPITETPQFRSRLAWAASVTAGPMTGLILFWLPLPLPPAAHMLAAILLCVLCYWVIQPIPLPVTAVLGTTVCAVVGLDSPKAIFASYGHPIIFLFFGSFLLAEAMAAHGVDRRVAIWMLSRPWVGGSTTRMLSGVGAATAVLSMWISNTAATALMLPIGLGILGTLRDSCRREKEYESGMMLMLSYAAAAGGLATIVGTPPNLIGAGLIAQQANVHLSFLKWLSFGLPLAIVLFLTAWALLHWLHPSTIRLAPALDTTDQLWLTQATWTRGQINACIAFGVAIGLWLIPGLAVAALGPGYHFAAWLDLHLPNELAALLAAGLLFVLPVDLRHGIFTLSWKQAGHINWGIILLFGGGLAFGELMMKTGLSQAIGEGFMALFGVGGVWKLTAMAIAAGVLVSEGLSNTASASLLVPVVIGIAQTAAIPPVPPALGACLGSSLGFALPVSTPPNAIVYGTGLVPMANMIRTGLLFDLIGAVLIWLALRIICPLIGLV